MSSNGLLALLAFLPLAIQSPLISLAAATSAAAATSIPVCETATCTTYFLSGGLINLGPVSTVYPSTTTEIQSLVLCGLLSCGSGPLRVLPTGRCLYSELHYWTSGNIDIFQTPGSFNVTVTVPFTTTTTTQVCALSSTSFHLNKSGLTLVPLLAS